MQERQAQLEGYYEQLVEEMKVSEASSVSCGDKTKMLWFRNGTRRLCKP